MNPLTIEIDGEKAEIRGTTRALRTLRDMLTQMLDDPRIAFSQARYSDETTLTVHRLQDDAPELLRK